MYIQVVLISQITKSLIQVRVHACKYILEIWEFKKYYSLEQLCLTETCVIRGSFLQIFFGPLVS